VILGHTRRSPGHHFGVSEPAGLLALITTLNSPVLWLGQTASRVLFIDYILY